MKKLSEQLNIVPSIKKTYFNNIYEIIKYVFKTDEYKFYLNSELIDVNDRFRVFNYKNKNFIIKKTNRIDGDLEVQSAQKAMKVIDGLNISNYTLKIVEPTIYYVDDSAYILTEYLGNSLQECNYSKQNKNFIAQNVIFEILNLFLSKGVLYRGFLPRNMVINNKFIYLLDWEDAIFSNKAEQGINLLWKTNFLLNWSYFYDYDELERQLYKYCNLENEPPLLKYEKKFKNMANLNYNDIELRQFILKTVMESEKNINENGNDFLIPPNDMAHLISDLFNSDLDVLFDIASSVLRKKSENQYIQALKKLSVTIADSYIHNENIQKNSIRILINFFETVSSTDFDVDNKLLTYFESEKIEFSNELKRVLIRIFYEFNGSRLSDENFERIVNYIYSFK
ncbi:unknown [Mycoplasma sp. CAG:472]|nr:unknown [Mycoplasma sp. CAG:472]